MPNAPLIQRLDMNTNMNASKTLKATRWVLQPLTPPPRRPDLVLEAVEDEALLFDPRNGSTHRLNETALSVWMRCDGRTGARQTAAWLAQTYIIDFDVALDHVEQLIAAFAAARLFDLTGDP